MSEPLVTYLLNGYVPDRALLPNRRNSVVQDSMLRGDQRSAVRVLINMTGIEAPTDLPKSLWCRFTVGWPKVGVLQETSEGMGRVVRRFQAFPDGDNLNASLKGALDAVADALGRDDKLIDLLPPVQQRDERGDGWTLIEIGVLE